MSDELYGFKIITSPLMVEQYRFPRSRKRRIRDKWKKRTQNFRPSLAFWISGGAVIYCHPQAMELVRRQLEKKLAIHPASHLGE